MKPELAGFDFEEAWQAAQEDEKMDEPEREARVLAAAEYAAAGLSVAFGEDQDEYGGVGSTSQVCTVTRAHWRWACQFVMCAAGDRPRCWNAREQAHLWDVTALPGYMQKLTILGYETPESVARCFDQAVVDMEQYLSTYPAGVAIVESGALRLQASTWRERLVRLGFEDEMRAQAVGRGEVSGA